MGSLYSRQTSGSKGAPSTSDQKESLPGSASASPSPGNTSGSGVDEMKTPEGQTGGLISDPRSPTPEICRTPICVTGAGKDVNKLKGKVVGGVSKQNSRQPQQ